MIKMKLAFKDKSQSGLRQYVPTFAKGYDLLKERITRSSNSLRTPRLALASLFLSSTLAFACSPSQPSPIQQSPIYTPPIQTATTSSPPTVRFPPAVAQIPDAQLEVTGTVNPVRFDDTKLNQGIVEAVSGVDITRIDDTLIFLSSFSTRNTCSGSDGIWPTRDHLANQLQTMGLRVILPEIAVPVCGSVTSCCPPSARPFQNVVGILEGESTEQVIFITGHYDTMNIRGRFDPSLPAPGINDGGSQTAAVLEVAYQMAAYVAAHGQLKATVVFIFFAGEEQGLLGSETVAQNLSQFFQGILPQLTDDQILKIKIMAMLNLDIVGGDNHVNTSATLSEFRLYTPGSRADSVNDSEDTPRNPSTSRDLMRSINESTSRFVDMTMIPKLALDRRGRGGDQIPFSREVSGEDRTGIAVARFIETSEDANCQHTTCDVHGRITVSYTGNITKVVLASALNLASAPRPPTSVEVTRTGPELSIRWTAPPDASNVSAYRIVARTVTDNFPTEQVVIVPAGQLTATVLVSDLGISDSGESFVSIQSVNSNGDRSLLFYPGSLCSSSTCRVPPNAFD